MMTQLCRGPWPETCCSRWNMANDVLVFVSLNWVFQVLLFEEKDLYKPCILNTSLPQPLLYTMSQVPEFSWHFLAVRQFHVFIINNYNDQAEDVLLVKLHTVCQQVMEQRSQSQRGSRTKQSQYLEHLHQEEDVLKVTVHDLHRWLAQHCFSHD